MMDRLMPGGRRARRAVAAAAVLPLAALALACSDRRGSSGDAALADDLRHDLELASSTGIELAGASRGSRQLVVSAIEGGPATAPKKASRAPTPRATGKRRAVRSPKAEVPAPEPVPETEAAAVQVAESGPSPDEPAPAPEPQAPMPVLTPAPVIIETGSGSEGRGRRGVDAGTVIGTVIGVVVRGAVVGGGDDHCDPREDARRRRGGGVIAQMPLPLPGGVARFPVSGTTFPRY